MGVHAVRAVRTAKEQHRMIWVLCTLTAPPAPCARWHAQCQPLPPSQAAASSETRLAASPPAPLRPGRSQPPEATGQGGGQGHSTHWGASAGSRYSGHSAPVAPPESKAIPGD